MLTLIHLLRGGDDYSIVNWLNAMDTTRAAEPRSEATEGRRTFAAALVQTTYSGGYMSSVILRLDSEQCAWLEARGWK